MQNLSIAESPITIDQTNDSLISTNNLSFLANAITDSTSQVSPSTETIITNLPRTSALHQILSSNTLIPLPKPTTNQPPHSITDALTLENSIDSVIASVAYSIRTLYVNRILPRGI